MPCDVKIFVSGQNKASKNTFFLFHLIFWGNLGLNIIDLKEKNVTSVCVCGVGGQKSPNKVSLIIWMASNLHWSSFHQISKPYSESFLLALPS